MSQLSENLDTALSQQSLDKILVTTAFTEKRNTNQSTITTQKFSVMT